MKITEKLSTSKITKLLFLKQSPMLLKMFILSSGSVVTFSSMKKVEKNITRKASTPRAITTMWNSVAGSPGFGLIIGTTTSGKAREITLKHIFQMKILLLALFETAIVYGRT